ncbi:MAG: alpha/beta hydrolase [Alphaproteobacteria bacterium]|nr:alpha/beta hydrolase [Alphaproteobacteria bacterium]
MRRGFVDVPDGQMFYREAGSGPPLVLIHQILRTSLDYRQVIPLLAERYRVIAFDGMGCGDSDAPPRPYTLEQHVQVFAAAMDRLGITKAVVAGHHSGATQAMELGVQRPDLAGRVVMSGLVYVEDSKQLGELHAKALKLKDPEPRADGSHLLPLWEEGLRTNWGKPRLPADRLDLLSDFFLEQIKTGPRRFEPYVAQMAYDASRRLPLLKAPSLFIKASDDIFMCAASHLWLKDQPKAKLVEIKVAGGGELPRLYPREWSKAILDFLG